MTVAWSQWQFRDLGWRSPLQSCVLESDWFPVHVHRDENDHEGRPLVAPFEQRGFATHQVHSQFLPQFPLQRRCVSLAPLAFSAREFPQPSVPFVDRTLADQELISAMDHRGDDADVVGRTGA